MITQFRTHYGVPDLDLYISPPLIQIEEATKILATLRWPRVYLCGVNNRGRDIAPFLLNLLPEALRTAISRLSKSIQKSPHLKGSKYYSDHMIRCLLNNKFLSKLSDAIAKNRQVGLFAPGGTLLHSSAAIGSNVDHLPQLLKKTYLNSLWVLNQYYIARRMMVGRLAMMKPLKRLK